MGGVYLQKDHDLIIQVLINLVGNALKFTYKEGEIIIRAYLIKNQKIRIEIVDTGIGILYNYQQWSCCGVVVLNNSSYKNIAGVL